MRSELRLAIAVLACAVVFVTPGSVLFGHHSNALFGDKLAEMDGTVVEFRWRNPHVTVVWDTTDQSGKVVRWRGELASVTTVMSHGMTKNSLKPGDNIRLRVYPAKTGSPESVIMHILRPDGSVVLGWSQQAGGSPERRAERERPRTPVEETK
jgi:hypothetical protein